MNDEFGRAEIVQHGSEERSVSSPKDLPLSEMQLRIARENPRNETLVLQHALLEIEMRPEVASELYYAIPFRDNRRRRITFVRGIGIEGSMILARRWGNSANASRMGQDLPERVVTQGYFFDYETGAFYMREVAANKWAKTKQGGSYRLAPDKLQMAILSAQSKAVRNAVLAGMPPYLKEAFFSKAREMVIAPPLREGQKAKSIDERIDLGMKFFVEKLGATKDEMKALYEKMLESDEFITPEEVLENLLGLKNAIKDQQITIEYALFRGASEEDQDMPQEMTAKKKPAAPASPAAAAK